MSNKLLLVGLGQSFSGIVYYLDLLGIESLTISDIDKKKEQATLKYVNKKYPNIKVDNNIRPYSYSLVLLAIDGKSTQAFLYNNDNFSLFRRKRIFVSLGRPNYDSEEDFNKLNIYVKLHSAVLFFGFGLEPGITETMIYNEMNNNINSSKIECFCGCIPKKPTPPLNYNILFGDKLPYHDRPAIFKKNGQVLSTTRYASKENIYVESIGILESFHDGLSPYMLKSNLAVRFLDIKQKTVRYPGFYDNIKPLLDMGMFSDTKIDEIDLSCNDLLHKILFKNKVLSKDPDDISFIFLVSGRENNKKYTLLKSEYDNASKISGAMKLTTFFFIYTTYLLLNGILNEDYSGVVLSFEVYKSQKIYDFFISELTNLNVGSYYKGDIVE
ncbi:hypothetical protein IB642_03985 [Allofrancisella guangzhouensis]|uniref:Saccharopine dehydrogenase-like C-terminal domain-containing protein n=1 Tax=Allofrancisella guangzhouensis TaxID=594679 RepID=A0A0A8E5T9_9GAMM|nr:saccharopine dehydrogenase C-terminal domain-containing protein [Allofrancisella guangzhouensis]AJC48967.1 hypothetical protein SD28_04625 [Allofrancisella guangzhouensis]MBK2027872.1 hypothetical protein [Allofrancisella guangzhouensis]MBK2044179.1 hypothetical protein [Allofrancisella guangzhouensis]MBK2045105.1 hypothetical protein [Allofrancisella guangzhouensis]